MLFIFPYSPLHSTPDPSQEDPRQSSPHGATSVTPRRGRAGRGPGAPLVRRVPPHPGGLSQEAGTGRGAAPGGAEAGATVARSERGAQPGRHRVALGRRAHGVKLGGWGGCPRPTMSAKKKGRTRPGAEKAPGLAPEGAGRILGARGACFAGAGWGSAEDLFPLRARAKASVYDSVSRSELQESGGGGAFLATAPHSGNPPALGAERTLASGRLGASGGWRGAAYPRRADRGSLTRAGQACRAAPLSSKPAPRPTR